MFHYTNREPFFTDVASVIIIFLNRGSNWKKMVDKSFEEMKVLVDWLRIKLSININDRQPGRLIGPDVVTVVGVELSL